MSTLEDAFAPLMEANPAAFRGKFRTMASDPHAFYRGSACVFYADVIGAEDSRSRTRTADGSGCTATCTSRTSAPI